MTDFQPKANARDLSKRIGPDMYRAAYKRGMSLSAFLETEDPSNQYKDGLDAFERQLKMAGIRTRSIPQYGVQADYFSKFMETEQTRALVPEFISRIWRGVATGRSVNTRGMYSSQDSAIGDLDNPWSDAADGRWTEQVRPAIPVAELIALNTPIDNDGYRVFYLTPVTDQQRQARVAEGADIPTFKLTGGDHTVRLHKFGGGLEASYEQLRRQRIDRLAMHVARMAVQAEVDKVATVLDVLVNGDGNSGTAATNYNLTSLDTDATAGTMTLKGWLAFKMKFTNPYTLTHALVQEAVGLQLLLLNTGSANTPLVSIADQAGFNTFQPINPGLADGVRMGWTTDAPTLKVVGFDSRFAIERVYEIGADITEVERYARSQTKALYMTEIEGFVKFDPTACKTLNVNA